MNWKKEGTPQVKNPILRPLRAHSKRSLVKLSLWTLVATTFLIAFQSYELASQTTSQRAYTDLIQFMSMEPKEQPLKPFGRFTPGLDLKSHKDNVDYFKSNPDLMNKIKSDLEGGRITWTLKGQKQRLLFVPEHRPRFKRLYKAYCQDLLDYLSQKTGIANPYDRIVILEDGPSQLPDNGLTAFIVHNLVRETQSRYSFSTNASQKSSELQLRATTTVNRVGSYASSLVGLENGNLSFDRDSYTIWQNNAKNPYTSLMVPAEETLHFILRGSTEEGIQAEHRNTSQKGSDDLQGLADSWLAVEEAVVGGLVYALMPPFLDNVAANLPESAVQHDLKTKMRFSKYRLLERGIEIVKRMGCKRAIEAYRADPTAFKALLEQPHGPQNKVMLGKSGHPVPSPDSG
jgi:hypothetical protein